MLVLFDVTCIAFLMALMLTPVIRNAANRFGLVDRPDTLRKFHLGAVPRAGGVSVLLAYAISLAFISIAPYRNLSFDIPQGISVALRLTSAATLIFLVGL